MKTATNLSYYMFNALYSFYQDNGQKPHIWVKADAIDNPVIRSKVNKEGIVLLNLAPHACRLIVEEWGLNFDGAFDGRKQGCLIKWEDIFLMGGGPQCPVAPMWFGAADFPSFDGEPVDAQPTPPKQPRPAFGVIQGGKQ